MRFAHKEIGTSGAY